MNRTFIAAAVVLAATSAFAQSAFTIRRPADGSVVKETVTVRIPRNSIPDRGYVGIYVNGKFLEAVAPGSSNISGNDFFYRLDTKARDIPDGRLNIQAVLFGDFGDSTRRLNESSVDVRVDNRTSIKAPPAGFKLRYSLVRGKEFVYRVDKRQSQTVTTEAQAKLGARAAELPAEAETYRYLVAIDNVYPAAGRKEGLVRLQAMPKKGKDYAILKTLQDPNPRRYYESEMHPIYMRITDTGREIFGRAPLFVPMMSGVGQQSQSDLFAVIPLPILPSGGIRTGDSWNAGIAAFGLENAEQLYTTDKLTKPQPARGTLEAIEYERGERCARIRNKIAVSAGGDGAEAEEVYWFSLDRGVVLKLERNYTRTVKIADSFGGGMGPGNFGPGGPGGPPPGFGGSPGRDTEFGIGPGVPTLPNSLNQFEDGGQPGGNRMGGGRRGGGRQGPPTGFGPSGPGGMPGPGGRASGGGGGDRIVRERTQVILTLEG